MTRALILALLLILLGGFYFNLQKTRSEKRKSPTIPAEYRFTANLQNGTVVGQLDIAAKKGMVRTEFKSYSFNSVVIHRDEFSFTLTPIEKIAFQNQNAFEWRFESMPEWKYLATEEYEGKSVDVFEYISIKDGERYRSKIYFDNTLGFPIRAVFQNGGYWELTTLSLAELDENLFEPPPSLTDKRGSPPKRFCRPSENTTCSHGWSCGDPCPGGNCC